MHVFYQLHIPEVNDFYTRFLNFRAMWLFHRSMHCLWTLKFWIQSQIQALFPTLPLTRAHMHEHQFYGVTSGFARIFMKTKNVCHGLFRPHGNFCNNRTIWAKILLVCQPLFRSSKWLTEFSQDTKKTSYPATLR